MILRPPEGVNLADVDTGREHLSPSSISTQLACAERFRWHYVERLEPVVQAPSLGMGKAFAVALEHGRPELGASLIEAAWQVLNADYGGNPWVVLPTEAQAETEATIVRAASKAYLEFYGFESRREVTLRQVLRNPATGRSSRTFDVTCRIDALADDGAIIEDKFTGQIPRTNADQLAALDRQFSIESYLAWRCTGEVPPNGLYRWTLKPQIRRRQAESHALYLTRIEADYEARPEHYLLESQPTRTPEDFLRLERELWDWAEQRRTARRAGIYPRNTSSCQDYGGCRFLPLCAREPGAIHSFRNRDETREAEALNAALDAVESLVDNERKAVAT